MIIGIVGIPNCGKTTLFNALTHGNAEIAPYVQNGVEPNVGVAVVPDSRVDRLSDIFKPLKTTYASVQYIDLPGLPRGSVSEGTKITEFLKGAREVDLLVHVVRAFDDLSVPHPSGSVDSLRDLQDLETELMLSDLMIIEKRLERIETEMKKGLNKQKNETEKQVFAYFREALEAGKPLRELAVSPEEEKIVRGYCFLTLKPMIIVLNIKDNLIATPEVKMLSDRLKEKFLNQKTRIETICARIEMEIGELTGDDARLFMDDLGIEEPAVRKLINTCYELLGLISFLTVGEDEVRSWAVSRGSSAACAGGAIHSDIKRGFIKAEVVSYNDFIETGSLANARNKGVLRLEGRDYSVIDGDIINFKFNV